MAATDIDCLSAQPIPRTFGPWRFLMRVFVTGASGWIGSALVPELIGAGHEVTGLARSDASAAALTAAGARVHRGDLADLDDLRGAAGAAGGAVHLRLPGATVGCGGSHVARGC